MTGVAGDGRPIALWAVPRSRSTAFLRVMIERGDLHVVHEPFSYLCRDGRFEVADRCATSASELLGALLDTSEPQRRVFFKETSDYRYDALLDDERLYRDVINTFMIREPSAAVASHHAVYPQVTLDEVGFEYLHTIFEAVRAATGEIPLVIDGDDLVANPEGMVRAFCARVGLPFMAEALRWESGANPTWQRMARWHQEVDRSTGLGAKPAERRPAPNQDPRLRGLVDHHQPFYEAMRAHRLVADDVTGRPARGSTPADTLRVTPASHPPGC